ncbi:putative Xaa-Pro aminopeptidase 1 [Cryptosporidium serpentis]
MSNLSRYEKLLKLRTLMKQFKIDAYIIPSSDPHMSEYPPSWYKRREFMTGFSGSEGVCLVTDKCAMLYVDGRYTVEASNVAPPEFQVHEIKNSFYWHIVDLLKTSKFIGNLGIDMQITSWRVYEAIIKYIKEAEETSNGEFKVSLKLLETNLVDLIWTDRQSLMVSSSPIFIHGIEYTGETSVSKIRKILETMQQEKSSVLTICDISEIAWILNLRGSDVECSPVFASFLILERLNDEKNKPSAEILYKIKFFVDKMKVTQEVLDYLYCEFCKNIQIFPIEDFIKELKSTVECATLSFSNNNMSKIWLPQSECSLAVYSTTLETIKEKIGSTSYPCGSIYELFHDIKLSSHLLTKISIVEYFRSKKNEVELDGMRSCHRYDGLALSRFLYYLDCSCMDDSIFNNKITEWDLSEKLYRLREEQPLYKYPSFPTISSIGSNGAIIHYRPSEENSKVIQSTMYLCDSGGQYLTGTTDVTRTLFLFKNNGSTRPTPKQIDSFTRVLVGFIRLNKTIFPSGTTGGDLDIIARLSLWEIGLDYSHSTGHGVGSFLCVHEGPYGIYKTRDFTKSLSLEPGMVLSIEPGYYEVDNFGIRIENLVEVVAVGTENDSNRQFLGFKPLTYAPIQKELIDFSILSHDEIEWLNWYHSKVLENIEPLIENGLEFLSWLVAKCAPVTKELNKRPTPQTLYQ